MNLQAQEITVARYETSDNKHLYSTSISNKDKDGVWHNSNFTIRLSRKASEQLAVANNGWCPTKNEKVSILKPTISDAWLSNFVTTKGDVVPCIFINSFVTKNGGFIG